MSFERRSYAGGAVVTTLATNIGAGDTSIALTDTTNWADGSGGPFFWTLYESDGSEESIKSTGRTGNTITGCTRGANGTTARTHAGSTAKHTASATDYDEANQHYSLTSLDHHLQYARADGTRSFTGKVTVSSGGEDVTGTLRATGASNRFGASAITNTTNPCVVLGDQGASTGAVVSVDGSSSNYDLAIHGKGTGVTRLQKPDGTQDWIVASGVGLLARDTAMQVMRFDGATATLVRVSEGATDSGGTGFRLLRTPN